MNTDIKPPHDDEDLNPKEQACCEEFINCLIYLLNIMAVAGNLHKVLCPELACISQSIPNVLLLTSRDIPNLTEDGIVIQVTDIPLQPLLHQVEATEQDLLMVN